MENETISTEVIISLLGALIDIEKVETCKRIMQSASERLHELKVVADRYCIELNKALEERRRLETENDELRRLYAEALSEKAR